MTPGPATWKIWGDAKDPLFEGTKEEVLKEYAEKYKDNDTTYIEDPDGGEWAWTEGKVEQIS